jgi:protein tyrosine/serine phosphatase
VTADPARRIPVRRLSLAAGLAVLGSAASCINLHSVEPGRVYRSAQPDGQQLTHWIWRYELETVLRLRGGDADRDDVRETRAATEAAGIDFVQVPMSATRFPDRETLVRLCDVFAHARYPLLLHCRAGADRSGLASAIYVLLRTGDLDRAREQLALRYLHTGLMGTAALDHVLDMYEPWDGQLSFPEWVRTVYEPPPDNELPAGYLAEQRERAAAARSAAEPEGSR